MLSNLSDFRVVLELYEDEPASCSKLLRACATTDPQQFLAWAQAEFLERPASRVMKVIAGLAISAGLVPALLDLHLRDRAQAIGLARKILESEPRFDGLLADCMVRPEAGAALPESSILSVLDLLESISEGDHLVASVLKMLKHDSPKIRSKAALFIGTRTQNLSWAASRAKEGDGRVRANILESLQAITAEGAHDIFRGHVHDENNRASGNAVLGLYMLGSAEAIPLAVEMGRHLESRFRNTAAWLMGRTRDPRFLPAIAELMKDEEPLVRSQAFKALGQIKRAGRTVNPSLYVSVLANGSDADKSISAVVLNSEHQPVKHIPATGFILRCDSGKPIHEFKVTEHENRGPLSVAFVACFGPETNSAADAACSAAIERCFALRRSSDRWSVTRLKKSGLREEYTPSDWPVRSNRTIFRDSDTPVRTQKSRGDTLSVEFPGPGSPLDQLLQREPQSVFTESQIETFSFNLRKPELGTSAPHMILIGLDNDMKANIVRRMAGFCPSIINVPSNTDRESVVSACYNHVASRLHHYEISVGADTPATLEVRHSDVTGTCSLSGSRAASLPARDTQNEDYIQMPVESVSLRPTA